MSSDSSPKVRVLMVCLGNICRSPTAHGILEKYIQDRKLQDFIEVDSAGTGDWHLGENPDPRAVQAAARRGYDIASLISRQVSRDDFHEFDYVLAMDHTNLGNLRALSPAEARARLQLLLDYGESEHEVVPDPYYSGEQGFEVVLDLLEEACERLLVHLQDEHLSDHDRPEPAS